MQTNYIRQDKAINVDVFTPERPGRFPVVIALHGSGGLYNGGHSEFAQLLANQGFCVFVPHYFESTGTTWASEATIWREFATWMTVISDAIDHAAEHPKADDSKIGIVGFSLGAYLALSLAVEQPRIKAVVDFFGGLPDHFAERLKTMAPVLILHGEADNVVHVEEARKIARLLDERKSPHEMKIYKNAGHGFRGFDMMDAGQRTYMFLKKHLG